MLPCSLQAQTKIKFPLHCAIFYSDRPVFAHSENPMAGYLSLYSENPPVTRRPAKYFRLSRFFFTVIMIKIPLFCLLQLAGFICYAQSESTIATNSAKNRNTVIPAATLNNKIEGPLNSIQKCDSIAGTTGVASQFAKIYSASLKQIFLGLQQKDPALQQFISKFDQRFLQYFLDAAAAQEIRQLESTSPWQFYFSPSELKPWQLMLLGVNTHINADMWQALVNSCSEEEIRKYRKQFLALEGAIIKAYEPFFDEMIGDNSYLRFMNAFTRGFAKFAGERWLYKWRKRNLRLAILYYDNPAKFKRKLIQVKKKKEKIDKLISKKQKFFL
jgi:hypothetical protein